ncbi:MAG: DJ-1/PfpI family protein [Clostridia bacterium]|nr:DJ-1/PfpI family protein [Clostridia bacterium]
MVVVFFAEGFEEVEALGTVDVLRRAKIDVKMIGIQSMTVKGSHGINVGMDGVFEDLGSVDDLECIVLPGGMPGTDNLKANDKVGKWLKNAEANGKYIAAICAAPIVLAHFGIMKGKKFTCYPGYEKDLPNHVHVSESVVTDGKLITARGVGVALEFGLEIVKHLKNPITSDALRTQMVMRD